MISISETIVVSFLYNNQILKKNSCPLHNHWNDLIFLIFLLFPTMCVSLIDRAPVTFVVEKPSVERKRNPAGEQLWTVFVFVFFCICSKLQNVFLYLMELAPVTFVVEKPLVERKRNPAGEQSWGREWWITQGLGGHTDCRTQIQKCKDTQIHLVNIKKSRRYTNLTNKHQIQNTEEGWMILGLGTLLGMGYGNIPPISGFCLATIARRVRGMQKTIFRAVATFVLDIR